jgi:hypothetical protein
MLSRAIGAPDFEPEQRVGVEHYQRPNMTGGQDGTILPVIATCRVVRS